MALLRGVSAWARTAHGLRHHLLPAQRGAASGHARVTALALACLGAGEGELLHSEGHGARR